MSPYMPSSGRHSAVLPYRQRWRRHWTWPKAREPLMGRVDDGLAVRIRGGHSEHEPLAGANAESVIGPLDPVEADADVQVAVIARGRHDTVQFDGTVGGVGDLGQLLRRALERVGH